eukprot:6184117-Pleurochrysis_carterae.AAC.2
MRHTDATSLVVLLASSIATSADSKHFQHAMTGKQYLLCFQSRRASHSRKPLSVLFSAESGNVPSLPLICGIHSLCQLDRLLLQMHLLLLYASDEEPSHFEEFSSLRCHTKRHTQCALKAAYVDRRMLEEGAEGEACTRKAGRGEARGGAGGVNARMGYKGNARTDSQDAENHALSGRLWKWTRAEYGGGAAEQLEAGTKD